MRLPKDQRKLLAFYARNVKAPDGLYKIDNDTLVGWLYLPNEQSLKNIKRRLLDKGLISFTYLEKHETSLTVISQQIPKEVKPYVTVTPEGFDLGMKYNNSLFGPFQIWFQENYKWLLPFIGTVILIIIGILTLRK